MSSEKRGAPNGEKGSYKVADAIDEPTARAHPGPGPNARILPGKICAGLAKASRCHFIVELQVETRHQFVTKTRPK
jgi:hypothetical protein